MSTPPARRRRIMVEDVGGVAVVSFVQRTIPDEQTVQDLGGDLFRLVDELGHRKVLLDLGGVEFLPSAALGKLITLHRKLSVVRGKLVLCRVSKGIAEVFRVTRLNRLFTVVAHPDSATTADIVREGFGDHIGA